MDSKKTYRASCHCSAVRFRFQSAEITSGRRCNCSICIRKGIIMSARYYSPEDFESIEGRESLRCYRFGDHDVDHYFCGTCGIHPFHRVASVPPTYTGPAKPGDYRVNLGCIQEFDALGLAIEIIDGRSF